LERHSRESGPRPSEDTVIQVEVAPGKNLRLMIPPQREDIGPWITYWWEVSSAAAALAGHLISRPDLSGVRVMELGCGLGLAGLCAALAGADVLFTDGDQESVDRALANARLNGAQAHRIHGLVVDWEAPGDLPKFDMIIGAEILYEYYFHGALLDVCDRSLVSSGSVILADRKRLCVERFLGRLGGRGFSCVESITRVDLRGFPKQDVSLFTLRRVGARHTPHGAPTRRRPLIHPTSGPEPHDPLKGES
jgi:predicted nicotinamide N-methyase